MIPHGILRQYIGQGMISPDLADKYARDQLPASQRRSFEDHVTSLMQRDKVPARMEEAKATPISKIHSDRAAAHAEYERQRGIQQQAYEQQRRYEQQRSPFDPMPYPSIDEMARIMGRFEPSKTAEKDSKARVVTKTMYLKI